MSLVAWFPLNGDLHNQGVEDVTLVKANATFTNDGKIGKCLASNNAATSYFTIPSLVRGKKLSITYWARINTATTTNWLDGVYWKTTADGTTFNANRQEFYNMKTEQSTMNVGVWYSGTGSISGYTVSLYDWHHFGIVLDYENGVSKFYVDGVLKNTKTDINTAHWLEGKFQLFDTNLDVSECDVRFFNHCLSDKEVKEISKGLVAHYKLTEPLSSTDTTVYDCSGYNYHGTINTAMSYSSNTARYSTSTSFNGTNNCITIPFNAMCPLNVFTVNLWFYKDTIGSKSFETLFGGPSGFEMDSRNGGATALSLYMASIRGGDAYSPLPFSEWTMITMVRDGTNELYYVNGELKKTITAKSMPTGTYYIGAWQNATSQNYYGLISDFRVYSTCLSAADILELYQTAASVDNNGNMFAYELKEG